MNCPHCGTTMQRIEYERIPICTCPDCRGEFLDYKRLRGIERRREIGFDVAQVRRLKAAPTGPTYESKISCPRCANTMSKIHYPKTEVFIDYCRACKGIWLDDKELEKIQILAETNPDITPDPSQNFGTFAVTISGARAAARMGPGESTEGQGYLSTPSRKEISISTPRLWKRLFVAGLFLVIGISWFLGVPHALLPLNRWFDPETLETLDRYLPVVSVLMSLAFATSFKKVIVVPKQEVTVKNYILGMPWTNHYLKDEMSHLASDYDPKGSTIKNVVLSAFVDYLLWGRYGGWFGPREYTRGVSYLYIVLASGKRILVYRGNDDEYLGELADAMRSGLGIKIKRI